VEVAVNRSWHVATLDPAPVGPWAWHVATLDPAPVGPWAWHGWSWTWNAEPGEHVLACRATDAAGNVQPTEQVWNTLGMGNNAVQQVAVTVS
jgi:hypothetical protein